MRHRLWVLTVFATAGTVLLILLLSHDRPILNSEEILQSSLEQVRLGKFAGIRAAIKELEKRPDGGAAASLLAARLQLHTNHPESALRELLRLDQDGPYRSLILLTAGEALFRVGQLAQAERALTEVIQAEPENTEAHRWLAVAYYDLGANDRAISELKAVIRLAPADYRPHHLLAVIYYDFEKYGVAVEHCQKAIGLEIPPQKRQDVTLLLCQAMTKLHSYKAALALAENVLASQELRVIKARCLWDLGRMDEARSIVAEARRNGDESTELSMLEADAFEHLGHLSQAEDVLRNAARKFPHDAQLRYVFGTFLQKTGKQEEARREMLKWRQIQQLRTELTELNLRAVQDPYDATVRDQLAAVCRQLGKIELAAMWETAAGACRDANHDSTKVPLENGVGNQ